MILADKIINERKKNGWSQEELAEKLEVSRQSVSKWESAQSIPDLQRVIRLAELFGVSTDYLLKEEQETAVYEPVTSEDTEIAGVRKVSMEEANTFLAIKEKAAFWIANGVSLCILSPAILILFAALSEKGIGGISEKIAAVVGVTALLVMVAVAVFIFITCNIRSSRMEYLENEAIETEYGITGMVKEKKRDFEGRFALGIAVGVVCCILAAVPLIMASIAGLPDFIGAALVSVLLLLVSVGVNMIVRVNIIKGSYDTLLQEGEYTIEEKQIRKKLGVYSGIYWSVITAIYLGWSFAGMRWEITWIVWPVAAVLFAAVSGIVRALVQGK